jgi:hypothetical protein
MADHNTHHHNDSHSSGELKSKTAFRSSFWFVLILVGLFIAALNFIEVMGHGEEEHEGHEKMEATSSQTLKEESGLGRPAEEGAATEHSAPAVGHDSAVHEEPHH